MFCSLLFRFVPLAVPLALWQITQWCTSNRTWHFPELLADPSALTAAKAPAVWDTLGHIWSHYPHWAAPIVPQHSLISKWLLNLHRAQPPTNIIKHPQTKNGSLSLSPQKHLIRDRVSELTPAFSSCATLDDFPPDVGSPQVTTEPSTSQNSQSPSWVDQQYPTIHQSKRGAVLCKKPDGSAMSIGMRLTLPRHFASLPSLLQMLHQYRLQQPHQPKDHHSPRHYCRRPWYSMAQRNSAKTKSETLGLSKLSCNLWSCTFSPPRCIISKKESAVAAQFQKCTGCSTNKCDHVELILHCSGISSPICISPGHHRSILGAALDSLATTCKKCYGEKRASPSLFLSLSLHPCLNLFISLLFVYPSLSYPGTAVLNLDENYHLHEFAYCLPRSCFRCCKSTICAAKLKDTLSDPAAALGCIRLP